MQISGEIREPGFKRNKANTKDVFSFKFIKDGTDKPMTIYLKESEAELQAEAIRANGSHVTIEGSESQSGDKTYFNPTAIKESPVTETVAKDTEKVTHTPLPQTRENSIETQVAVKAVVELMTHDLTDLENPDMAKLVQDTLAWIRARIPHSVAEITKKAPIQEPEGTETILANAAQLSNLKKYVKAKSQAELLSIAKYRYPDSKITKLEDLTLDQADEWLAEVMK